jgi:hypothetical protein
VKDGSLVEMEEREVLSCHVTTTSFMLESISETFILLEFVTTIYSYFARDGRCTDPAGLQLLFRNCTALIEDKRTSDTRLILGPFLTNPNDFFSQKQGIFF